MNSEWTEMNDKGNPNYTTGPGERFATEQFVIALNLGSTRCPIFGLKALRALRSLKPGQLIEIASAGHRAGKALRRVSRMTGTRMIGVYEEDGQFKHVLRKD